MSEKWFCGGGLLYEGNMEFERHPEFKYVLGEIWDAGSEYWLQISDVYKYGWDWNLNMMEDEGPIGTLDLSYA